MDPGALMDRHMILTLGRSGSNTLRDMLNQNPEVLNFGEVLGPWTDMRRLQKRLPLIPKDDAAYLDFILTSRHFPRIANTMRNLRLKAGKGAGTPKRLGQIRTFGIKDFSLTLRRAGLADYLAARPAIKVIGLVRENVVDRMISNAMLGATGVVEMRRDPGSGARGLTIDPTRIAGMLDEIAAENADLRAMLGTLPPERVRIIRYEDLFSDPETRQATLSACFAFLGVRDWAPQERMVKIIRTPVSQTITNYDACLAAVAGTPHEDLLRAADTPA